MQNLLFQCSDFVDTYTPMIVQLLLEKVTPDRICEAIDLCSSSEVVDAPEGTMCAACEWVMSMVENFLLENRTESEIIDFLGNVCYSVLLLL